MCFKYVEVCRLSEMVKCKILAAVKEKKVFLWAFFRQVTMPKMECLSTLMCAGHSARRFKNKWKGGKGKNQQKNSWRGFCPCQTDSKTRCCELG